MMFIMSSSHVANFTEFSWNSPFLNILMVTPKEQKALWRCIVWDTSVSGCTKSDPGYI